MKRKQATKHLTDAQMGDLIEDMVRDANRPELNGFKQFATDATHGQIWQYEGYPVLLYSALQDWSDWALEFNGVSTSHERGVTVQGLVTEIIKPAILAGVILPSQFGPIPFDGSPTPDAFDGINPDTTPG